MGKISAEPAAGSLDGSEVVPLLKSGANKQTTTQAIANLAPATPPGSIPTAAQISYDPSTSAGDPGENGGNGLPVVPHIYAGNVQTALDWLNRDVQARDLQTYMIAVRDAKRGIYPLVGAAPTTGSGEFIPGIAPLDLNRLVPLGNLGTGTPTGGKFLRGDGVWSTPVVTAQRSSSWQPADNGLKSSPGHPGLWHAGLTSQSLAASRPYLTRVWLEQGAVITNYIVNVDVAAVSPAANLYAFSLHNADATGTLVTGSGSADAANVWLTAGASSIALGTPFTVPTAGYYWILSQMGTAGTQPKCRVLTHNTANLGLAIGASTAPNGALAPIYGVATNSFSGLTPPATTGVVIESGNTHPFFVGLT